VQPPYNLFERDIETAILPYCRKQAFATLGYGALCHGLLSGRMRADTKFEGDDLRRTDPKFQPPSDSRRKARSISPRPTRQAGDSLGGARDGGPGHHCGALGRSASRSVAARRGSGWSLDASAKAKTDQILDETITDSVGPEFMAPSTRS